MAKVDNYLRYAVNVGASDLHIICDSIPHVRLHGELRPVKANKITPAESKSMATEILTPEQQQIFERELDIDFCYEARGIGRFRTNVLHQRNGVNAIFRVVPSHIRTLDDLGFPAQVKDLTRHSQGMVLVTGPAGSGKTTTLAAMIDYINSERKLHIITIEDPVEYLHPRKMASVTQREVPKHTGSFAAGLRAALREDPDVILIGELRDLETVSLAITAAETGHLVFGTLHTRSACKTVDRIIDVFPPSQQSQVRAMFAESMRGIISQQLIPRADGQGRVLAHEILLDNPAIANLIREGKTFQIPSLMQIGVKEGMVLMDHCLLRLLNARLITQEQALSRIENRKLMPAQTAKQSPAPPRN
jgi:twitching motility protein PilT